MGRPIQLAQNIIFVQLRLSWKSQQNLLYQVRHRSTKEIKFVNEQRDDQRVRNSTACARASNSREGNTKETFISTHFYALSPVYERSFGRPTLFIGFMSCVEAANFAGILCFQNMRNLHVWHAGSRSIFVRFCSSKKQCLSKAINFHISNFWMNYPFNYYVVTFRRVISCRNSPVSNCRWAISQRVFETIYIQSCNNLDKKS